jgi:excisionase family DNA binding protein
MQWLTLSEAAERTRYSTRTLERYIQTSRLQAYRGPGRQLRLRSDDVDALFKPVVL